MTAKQWLLLILALLVAGAIIVRIMLPIYVEYYAEKTLDENKEYSGKIENVDIQLWRGAVQIYGLDIVKLEEKGSFPFFNAEKIDISVFWSALLRGVAVTNILIEKPELNFVHISSPTGIDESEKASWEATLRELMPFKVNNLEVNEGIIHFRNLDAEPKVHLWLADVDVHASNITNISGISKDQFIHLKVSGRSLGKSSFELNAKVDPSAAKPTFDLNSKLLNLELPLLNAFFKEYMSLDFESGSGDIVAEIAADKGSLNGYVKPLFVNLDVFSMEDLKENDSILTTTWEAVAGALAEVFENQAHDQLATKIPIKGAVEDPDTDIFTVLGMVLRNAFVQAFQPFYDGSVSLKKAR